MIDEKKLIAEIREKIIPEKFGERCNALDVIYAVLRVIDEQPKVAEWIPCSERLPKTSQDLEVTCKNGGRFVAYYTGKNWYHCITNAVVDVIAWKEPSEPWEEERNEVYKNGGMVREC